MSPRDELFRLFLESQEKINNASNKFEDHFDWLATTVLAARLALSSDFPAVMPKTPRKGRKTKRTLITVPEDDVVPAKRSSTGSQNQNEDETEENSTQTPPRRGRAASRVAREKSKKQLEMKANMKMRRPSTPEPAMPTTVKKRGTRAVTLNTTTRSETNDTSDEARRSETRKSPEEKENEPNLNLKLEEKENESNLNLKLVLSPLNTTPKKSMTNSTKRLSVNLVRERLSSGKISETGLRISGKADNLHDKENMADRENVTVEKKNKVNKEMDKTTKGLESISDDKDKLLDTTQATHSETVSSCNTTQINLGTREEQNTKPNREETSQLDLGQEKTEDKKRGGEEDKKVVGNDDDDEDDDDDDVIPGTPKSHAEKSPDKKKSQTDSPDTEKSLAKSPETKYQADKLPETSESEDEDEVVMCTPPKPVPRGRVTRTKQRELQSKEDLIIVKQDKEEECVSLPTAKPRSTRTKQKQLADVDDQTLPPPDVPKPRVTRTKVKTKEVVPSCDDEPEEVVDVRTNKDTYVESVDVSEMAPPPDAPKPRVTRTKVKAKETVNIISIDTELSSESKEDKADENESQTCEEPSKARSTRTKKKTKVDAVEDEIEIEEVSETLQKGRSTRTKKRQVEAEIETSTKRRKTDELETEKDLDSKPSETEAAETSSQSKKRYSQDSVSSSGVSSASSNIQATQTARPAPRITRSKMRQAQPIQPAQASPVASPRTPKTGYHKDCLTPKGTEASKKPPMKSVMSPSGYFPQRNRNGVEEMGRSPTARTTRNSIGKGSQGEDKLGSGLTSKGKSPMTLEKGMRGRPPFLQLSGTSGSSGSSRLTPKTLSRIHFNYTSSSSSQYNKTQTKLGTPGEGRRPLNLLTGVNSLTSFIKVQPAKPTREEIEEQKQQERQKKWEKEEEQIRKREEMMKAKVEEKKRANLERMRRVQEVREERERKAKEVKEQQEREKRQREEKQREEQQRRKQQLLAKKKAEEEIRLLRIKEQEEEERRKKEEERRKQLEERKQEEERRAQLAEQRRLEEERRRRVAEVDRIAREKKEMEKLKQQEAQRKAAAAAAAAASPSDVLNDTYTASSGSNDKTGHNTTYTAHNSTYTAHNSTYTADNPGRADSYEMTPVKKPKVDKANANNYNIDDLKSDDSTDDDGSPRKKIPAWAMKPALNGALIQQDYYPPNIDQIFPHENLLGPLNLCTLFNTQRRRYFKRTSSAIWNTPPMKMPQGS